MMKFFLISTIVIFVAVFFYLINYQIELKTEVEESIYIEKRLEEDIEILIQLIQIKGYHYNDFKQIVDDKDIVRYIIMKDSLVYPISINNYIFSFDNDSTLKKIYLK